MGIQEFLRLGTDSCWLVMDGDLSLPEFITSNMYLPLVNVAKKLRSRFCISQRW